MATTVEPEQLTGHCQHVHLMCYSDRADHSVSESWWARFPKPWDPPLTDIGRIKALETGKKLQAKLGFPIRWVVSSPFWRCNETAWELITGLSMEGEDATNIVLDDGNSANSSTSGIKVELSLLISRGF
ncbi:hypothetical protein ACJRO7_020331 [Eucalyptus globulus]|uniref:Uncharacterized protein n=1 Tax=Eucalyptus globulus TaxID=34317 RepID=A0ABD3KKT4_EUCGL